MYAAQVGGTASWVQELAQEASVTLSVFGTFVDAGVVDGQADMGDEIAYTFQVQNIGSVTLAKVGKTHSRKKLGRNLIRGKFLLVERQRANGRIDRQPYIHDPQADSSNIPVVFFQCK